MTGQDDATEKGALPKLNEVVRQRIKVVTLQAWVTEMGKLATITAAGAALLLAVGIVSFKESHNEVRMALVIIVGLVALLAMLFLLAAGFNQGNLSDVRQPLGLPEGSIRAVIALLLILVFIMFGLYVFRSLNKGREIVVRIGLKSEEVKQLELLKVSDGKYDIRKDESGDTYSIVERVPSDSDATRSGQQLLTTVGTLVVAISSFYFGSTVVSNAFGSAQQTKSDLKPTISNVEPKEGKANAVIHLTILGTNLNDVKMVRLNRGNQTITTNPPLSSDTMLKCDGLLSTEGGGEKWDVVVETSSGLTHTLSKVFSIQA